VRGHKLHFPKVHNMVEIVQLSVGGWLYVMSAGSSVSLRSHHWKEGAHVGVYLHSELGLIVQPPHFTRESKKGRSVSCATRPIFRSDMTIPRRVSPGQCACLIRISISTLGRQLRRNYRKRQRHVCSLPLTLVVHAFA
jgi:hypothetical protein